MTFRSVAKKAAYQLGAMSAFHRARHRECLTVVMFHRVMPDKEQAQTAADPLYAVTPEFLSECVAFFKRNYAIVGLNDVLQSLKRVKPLPSRPLLITADDGWRDNADWALPVLRDIPWTLFVATDAIQDPECWWQEVLLWALRSGRASFEDLWRRAEVESTATSESPTSKDILSLVLRYANLTVVQRKRALSEFESELRHRFQKSHMLTVAEVASLRAAGVDIASHGASHLPLSRIDDPASDLRRAKEWLEPLSSHSAMSFPHGRHNEKAVDAARRLGYEAIFTSDPLLNPCPRGWLESDLIGRIPLSTESAGNEQGGLAPERLAPWLYLRDRHSPSADFM